MDESIIPKFQDFDILKDFEVFRDEIGEFKLPRYRELPDVGLYMDQVVSIIDKYFKVLDRDDDKPIITSSMINNYVKLGIIPPPVRKRYGADHLAYLIMICLLKQVLSMTEITLLLGGYSEELDKKYDKFCSLQEKVFTDLDIADTADPLSLSMLALTTKLYAQKLIKIQLDAIRTETAKIAVAREEAVKLEAKKAEDEKKRIEEEKKKAEEDKKRAEEEKKKAEEAKRKAEDEKRKAEKEEKRRLEEEKRKAEESKKNAKPEENK